MTQLSSDEGGELARPAESRSDPELLRSRLETWIRGKAGPDAAVTRVEVPSANGMSSETLLADARWDGSEHALAVRIAPSAQSDPVFESYDLPGQFQVIGHVAAHTAVPVPELLWCEPDTGPLGAPFFVMSRVDGRIPPDVMPYTFDSWVTAASDAQRAELTRNSVAVLAQVHSAPIDGAGLEQPQPGETPLTAHVRRLRAFYDWASTGRAGAPLIERGFAWILENLPEETDPVLCWGDARIGNIIYGENDFAPRAVLDWEMAAIGPRELDVAWMIFIHRFFQDLTVAAGLAGLPYFLRRADVVDHYAELTGYRPQHMDFYTLYAALIHAVVMYRVTTRTIHFGQAAEPDDPDDMIMHRATLEAMLAGTYWTELP